MCGIDDIIRVEDIGLVVRADEVLHDVSSLTYDVEWQSWVTLVADEYLQLYKFKALGEEGALHIELRRCDTIGILGFDIAGACAIYRACVVPLLRCSRHG